MKTDRVRVFLLTAALCSLAAQGDAHAWPKLFKKKNKAPATVPSGDALRAADMDAAGLMAKAREAEAAGKEKAAMEGYRKIVQNYPYSSHAPVAQFRIAAAVEKDRKFDKAFEEYQKLISNYRQSPQFSEALDRQFNIAMMGRTQKVGRTFGFKSRMSPEDQIDMLSKVIANAPQDAHAAECQFEIGRVHEEEKERDAAIASYRKVVSNYPRSPLAREAQQKITETYMAKAEKSRDASNAEHAREATVEAEALFGSMTPELSSATGAIDEAAAENSYNTGKFYQKQGKYKSAMIYYSEVLKSPGSPLYDDTLERVNEMSVKDPTVKDSLKSLAISSRSLAVQAAANTKGRRDYFGPPGPAVAGNSTTPGRPAMRGDYVPLAPLEPGDLPSSPGTPDPSLLDPNALPPVDPNVPMAPEPGTAPPTLEPPLEPPPPSTPPAADSAAPAETPADAPVEEKRALPVDQPKNN